MAKGMTDQFMWLMVALFLLVVLMIAFFVPSGHYFSGFTNSMCDKTGIFCG